MSFKVLTLVDQIGVFGGGEILAREVATRLDPERFESTFCVSRWDPAWAERPAEARLLEQIRESGTRFLGIERHGRPALLPWRKLITYLRRERIDVLHAHKFGSNAWAAPLSRLGRVPVVVAHEHTWSFEGGPRMLVDRHLIARAADRMIAVSREDQRRMTEIERIPAEKIVLIPNGVAAGERRPGNDVRAELGIDPGAPVIGTAVTLHRYKAVDNLIRAAAELTGRFPDLQVLVAGGRSDQHPEHLDELHALIAELGLEGTVRMLGLRTDVPDVIDALDVAVCPSDQEGSPLAVIEYMDAAKPVVGTDAGGVPDLISEGETGFVVPTRDPRAMATAIAGLLDSPAERRRMGEAGRRRRLEEFDVAITARRVGELYLQLLEEQGRG